MAELFDPQFANVTDYDCFSQAVFRSLEDYKRMKQDPWYKEHLIGDHENFADTKRSQYVLFSCFSVFFYFSLLHFYSVAILQEKIIIIMKTIII
jgi:hypothetical protein